MGENPKIASKDYLSLFPGALSSGKPAGSDFQAVLEAFTKTAIPFPRSGKWPGAGMVRGRGVDLAWCVYNAQYFGTAQRRRRIFLVADFTGASAGEILFIPQSLSGYFAAGGTPRQGFAAFASGCADGAVEVLNDQGGDSLSVEKDGHSPTLRCQTHGNLPVVAAEQMMYATLPLYNIINYKVGTYSMHYLIIGIFIAKYFGHTKISVYKLLLFLALFVLRIFAGDFVLLVSWSLLIFPLVLTLDEPIWKDNIKKIVFWMNISMLLSCFAGYIMMIMQKTIYTTAYLYISGVSTVRFAGLTGDSVVFGQTCVLMIAINLVLCYFNPNRKGFYVTSSIILSMAALLSYSKMTLICIFLALLLFLALYGKEYVTNRKRFLRSLVVAGVLIILVLAAMSVLMDYSGNSAVVLGYIDRFTRDDLSTGRFSLWGVYLEMLDSRPRNLFVPLTSKELTTPIWNPSTGGYVSYVHNLYLETVAAFGWCAAILIFMWIIRRLYRYVSKKNKMILLLPIFVLLFMGLGSHGNFEYQFYLQLALALAFMHPEMAQALRMEGYNDAVD